MESGIHVNVAETTRLDVVMTLAIATENVSVEATPTMVQTESSTLGRVVNEQAVTSLPLVTHNYTQIIGLSLGIEAPVTNATDLGRGNGGLSPTQGTSGTFVHRSRSFDNNFQINGISVNGDQETGNSSGGVPIPNADTIEEFKVQTGLYGAAFAAVHRTYQFRLQFSDLLCIAARLPREPSAVSYRLVRRIAGNLNAAAARHPYVENPIRSRPSGPLTATCLVVVAIGTYLPFSPLAGVLGFTPLPAKYFAFLAVAVGAYLLLVEAAQPCLVRGATQNASDDRKQPGFYLIMAMGSEQAGLTGVKGSIVRKAVVCPSVSNLQNALTTIRNTLEGNQ